MGFLTQYSVVLALIALVVVVIVLLSAPAAVFSPGVAYLSTGLQSSSSDAVLVRTQMDFASADDIAKLPHVIGQWEGYDYSTAGTARWLGADALLLRGYDYPGLYQPVFFTIVQAKTESSFHPPPVCYTGQGYKVQEVGREEVAVTDTTWTETPSRLAIPLNKMVVFKESGRRITERRVVLYYYVKSNPFISDAITMIQVEALVPTEGPYDGMLEVQKDFVSETIPHMFAPTADREWKPLALRLAESGVGGYFAIAFMLFVPVAIAIYPRAKRRRGSVEEPPDEA